ncbi:MAG: acylphosphatase [Citrobacter freundii]|nr:MAG: acylphosphatase [Citrobacter freundii]
MTQTISIVVTGKVQGVFYRKSARDKALELGLTGEVRNQDDGSVHIIATGEPDTLTTYLEWCKQGPPRAIVNKVETTAITPRNFLHFKIIR